MAATSVPYPKTATPCQRWSTIRGASLIAPLLPVFLPKCKHAMPGSSFVELITSPGFQVQAVVCAPGLGLDVAPDPSIPVSAHDDMVCAIESDGSALRAVADRN